MKTRLAVMHN
uniref:Uncharacterized protein n=1 Tax=Anguilla anguilla TaxID=7936 RepID=A0A0E9QYX5_ANGAN